MSLPEDVNVSAVVAAAVVVCLVVVACVCGGFLLHRSGFFGREFVSWVQFVCECIRAFLLTENK